MIRLWPTWGMPVTDINLEAAIAPFKHIQSPQVRMRWLLECGRIYAGIVGNGEQFMLLSATGLDASALAQAATVAFGVQRQAVKGRISLQAIEHACGGPEGVVAFLKACAPPPAPKRPLPRAFVEAVEKAIVKGQPLLLGVSNVGD